MLVPDARRKIRRQNRRRQEYNQRCPALRIGYGYRTDWSNKKLRKRFPMLELIRTIAPAEMRRTPAIQAADMVAWARNRLAVPSESLSPFAVKPILSVGDNFSLMAKLIYLATGKGRHYTLDETQLATRRFPENNLKP